MHLYGAIDQAMVNQLICETLQEAGFVPNLWAAAVADAQAERLGTWIRDEVVPGHLPVYVCPVEYRHFAEAVPVLWAQLGSVMGSGFRHTAVLQPLVGTTPTAASATALLGAVLWGAIIISDILVDEHRDGVDLLNALDGLPFDQGLDELTSGVARIYATAPGVHHRLLLALMGTFLDQLTAVAKALGCAERLPRLVDLLGEMYGAQRRVSLACVRTRDEARTTLADAETKSVQPSVLLAHLVALGASSSQDLAEGCTGAATMGRLFWLMDDLMDLAEDWQRGTPNIAVAAVLEAGAHPQAIIHVVKGLTAELMALYAEFLADSRLEVRSLASYAEVSLASWGPWLDFPAACRFAGKAV